MQRDSRFGHPHPAVVERYKALGARVFRTDEHGAVTVRTDGQSVWIEPYIGGSVALSAPVTHRLVETLTSPSPAPR
jgi:competence protein ComEC